MARIVEHLPLEELEARYRAARDATEARHFQAIWLLARGRTILEVAAVLAFRAGWSSWPRATTRSARTRWATGGAGTAGPPAC